MTMWRTPIDATTARVLNRLAAIGETRLEGQRGYLGRRLDIGYASCWCGRMPAEHGSDQLHHYLNTVETLTWSDALQGVPSGATITFASQLSGGVLTVTDVCSECADTGTTFDDNDQPIPCPRCNT